MKTLASVKEEMTRLLPRMDSKLFDADIFKATGVFVVRKGVQRGKIEAWRNEYYRLMASREGGREKTFHPVQFLDLIEGLDGIWRDPEMIAIVSKVFGPNVGLFCRRFVIKDRNYKGKVFLHQDTAYHMGTVEKASLFLALSEAGPENGGMVFYPGTFRFGYLGDAGELKPNLLPEDWPKICPRLEPGDLVLMHSMTWHESLEFEEGPDRILADFIYQDSRDPSTIEVLAGEGGWETNFLNNVRAVENYHTTLFQRSRTTLIVDLKKKLEDATGKSLS